MFLGPKYFIILKSRLALIEPDPCNVYFCHGNDETLSHEKIDS